MDELLPLDKNSAEFQAVFGNANVDGTVANKLTTDASRPGVDITDDVVRFINADPILRQDVYAYYLTTLSAEPFPSWSLYAPYEYISGPVSVVPAEALRASPDLAGQFPMVPPRPELGQPNYVGSVQIAPSQFATAEKFVNVVAHELSGHFPRRAINYGSAATIEDSVGAYLQTEALAHLRQAQNAESIEAAGGSISTIDDGQMVVEVAFLQQERARINSENPTASPETKELLLVSAFGERLSRPDTPANPNPYSRLLAAMVNAIREFPVLATANGEVFGVTVGVDSSGNPFFVYTKGTIVVEGIVDVNGACRVYDRGRLATTVTVTPQRQTTTVSFDEAGSLASVRDQHVFDDGSSIITANFPDGTVVTTTRDAAGVVVSETTQNPPTGPITNPLTVTTTTGLASGAGTGGEDPAAAVNDDSSTLIWTGIVKVQGVGNVNADSGNTASANDLIADGWMPGAGQLTAPDPVMTFGGRLVFAEDFANIDLFAITPHVRCPRSRAHDRLWHQPAAQHPGSGRTRQCRVARTG